MRNPRQIAAALRALAEDVDAIGNIDLAQMQVSINVQVVPHDADQHERTSTVNVVAAGLGGSTEVRRLRSGDYHYGTPYDAEAHGVGVGVFTALPELAVPGLDGRAA
jgi:hypothetical protein